MRYIRQVHVEYPGTSNEHISQVRYSPTIAGTLSGATREQIIADIDRGQSYRSHNDRTGDEARVETRRSTRGTRYIATVADGRETNNLLGLPRF
jgi:hypothetical protein